MNVSVSLVDIWKATVRLNQQFHDLADQKMSDIQSELQVDTAYRSHTYLGSTNNCRSLVIFIKAVKMSSGNYCQKVRCMVSQY